MKLYESDIKKMVRECLGVLKKKRMLNEISMQAAYDKFYSGKLTPDEWNSFSSGAENMTPFHKAALDVITNCKNESERFKAVVNVGQVWAQRKDIRKALVDGAKNATFKDVKSLLNFIDNLVIHGTPQTKNMRAEKGLVVLLENDKILVTCTTSYSASRKYYGDSHWCTASGIDGEMDGYKAFLDYVQCDGGLLIQFVPKLDRSKSYQIHYSCGNIECVFDYYDEEVDECDFCDEMLEKYGLDVEEFLDNIDNNTLMTETCNNVTQEDDYWTNLSQNYINKARNELAQCIASQNFLELVSAVAASNGERPDLVSIANHFFMHRRTFARCGNLVTKVMLTSRLSQEEAVRYGILTKNAYNYISRAESDDDVNGDLLYLYFITTKDGKIIKYYFGHDDEIVDNVLYFHKGNPYWDEDGPGVFVSIYDGKKLAEGRPKYYGRSHKIMVYEDIDMNNQGVGQVIACIDTISAELADTSQPISLG